MSRSRAAPLHRVVTTSTAQALQPAPNIMNGLRKLFSSVNPFDLSKEWHAGKLSWKAKRKWWKWTTDYAWVGLKKCKTHYCLKAVVKLLGMEWIPDEYLLKISQVIHEHSVNQWLKVISAKSLWAWLHNATMLGILFLYLKFPGQELSIKRTSLRK